MGGGPGGMGGPGLGALPCFKGIDFKLSLKNSTTVELSGTLMPQPISYQLPFNGSEMFEKTKDVVLYGITGMCGMEGRCISIRRSHIQVTIV